MLFNVRHFISVYKTLQELRLPEFVPGCSGTRNLADNLSDLRAQVAANQRGIGLINELIDEYGLDVVQVLREACVT